MLKKTIHTLVAMLLVGGLVGMAQIKPIKREHSSKKTTLKQSSNKKNNKNSTSNSPAERQFTVEGVTFTMIKVDGGTFLMGALRDLERTKELGLGHKVTLSSYYIGDHEVTQALWQAVMGNNPSKFKGDLKRPVEQVSWDDCQVFIRKLNQITGQEFRLPTEAEWEFAARGGNRSHNYQYSGSNSIADVAWFCGNSVGTTHPVGTKDPNELGLYDMSGNVEEWCHDYMGSMGNEVQTNPKGPSSGLGRVIRGGVWGCVDWQCSVHHRNYNYSNDRSGYIGLRLAL